MDSLTGSNTTYMGNGQMLIKCNSGRARENLIKIVGPEVQGYYRADMLGTAKGGIFEVADLLVDEVLLIKGTSKASTKHEYLMTRGVL